MDSIDVTPLKDTKVIFVIGGPGSGKGTQCKKIAEKYGYSHISAGDLYRAEVQSGSERGKMFTEMLEKRIIFPNYLMADMVKEAMLANVKTSKGFLIDGFPKKIDEGIEFEKEIVPCQFMLYLEASDETMKKRVLDRGLTSGRTDDNEASIKKRIITFHKITKQVIDYYEKQNKLIRVNSENSLDDVFNDIQSIFSNFKLN